MESKLYFSMPQSLIRSLAVNLLWNDILFKIFPFSRVRLAINRKTKEAVAVKIVNSDKLADNKDGLKKEVFAYVDIRIVLAPTMNWELF